jgi:hypothetical protein
MMALIVGSTMLSMAAPALATADTNNYTSRIKKRWNPRPTPVPELGLAAAGAAVVLVGGGLLVANGRKRKSKNS